MQPDFWLQRWKEQQTGFHLADVNPHLRARWPALGVPAHAPVFVPLCGKTRDMRWLRNLGHRVVGVELSQLAAEAFFLEDGHTPSVTRVGDFNAVEADGIRILVGDFFHLRAEHLDGAAYAWDRASLVALPPDMRARYAAHLSTLMPAGAGSLLVTFDYAQEQMAGPPFAVREDEVRALFGARAQVDVLDRVDIIAEEPRFRERGLSALHENVYRLTFR